MKKIKYGRIVNISTIHVPLCTIGTSIYGASKASIEQFSKVIAREIFPLGITINTIALSIVKSMGMSKIISENTQLEILSRSISKSQLEPEDIVNAIDFIISNKSKMITNQIIYLGGI